MSSVTEIENAVAKLSREEFLEFERWFEEERNRKWDKELEQDAENGRLMKLYEKLTSEKAETNVPLDEVLGNEKLS